MENESIVILTACDANFKLGLAVLLKSIEKNHKGPERIIVYCIQKGFTKLDKEKIQKPLSGIEIKWKGKNNV